MSKEHTQKAMSKRFDVSFNPKLRNYIKKALADPNVKNLLAYYHLKENEQGIAKLALTLFLRDTGIVPEQFLYKHVDSKK